MSCLLNDGLECKDVVNGLVLRSESSLSSGSELPPLKLPIKLQMEGRSIKFRKCVAYHDHPVVVGIRTRARFVNQVNNVM
jgi:hypothetical protein